MSAKWERLEDFINSTGETEFTAVDLAVQLGVAVKVASTLIQYYLRAQRGPKSRTLYCVHRTGRTTCAVWHVGHRTAEAKSMNRQYVDDVATRAIAAVLPDLRKIGINNAQARKLVGAMTSAITANVEMMAFSAP